MVPEPYLVKRTWRETHDTFTMELAPAKGGPSLRYEPGQFTMLYVFGVGEVPISISGDPRGSALIQTVREVGTVTRRMAALRPGDVIGVRGPFGSTWPMAAAEGKDVVIAAGGVGLPPLRPVIHSVLAQRARFGRLVVLYGARSPGDMMFPRELKAWGRAPNTEVNMTVDRAAPGWKGNVGVVTTLIPNARFDPFNTVAMIVGPEVMMRFTVMELMKRRIPESRIFVSMERNMKCGIGLCGHCQIGPHFICKDGPVFRHDKVRSLVHLREV